MDIDETIRGRRSVRKYRNQDIADSVIDEILDLARQAPSSMNGQPWYFTVVRKDETKRKLAEIKNKYCPVEKRMYRADFIQNASAIIIVCVDKNKSYDRGIENGVLASTNILLAAYSKGLGSVYMSAYKTEEPALAKEIRQTLGIPEHVDPISIIPLGYPDEVPEPKDMQPLHGIVSYETFGRR
jgi:nitroreductase